MRSAIKLKSFAEAPRLHHYRCRDCRLSLLPPGRSRRAIISPIVVRIPGDGHKMVFLIPFGDNRLLSTKEARPALRSNLGIPLVAENRS
jgi:hypothetical protein